MPWSVTGWVGVARSHRKVAAAFGTIAEKVRKLIIASKDQTDAADPGSGAQRYGPL